MTDAQQLVENLLNDQPAPEPEPQPAFDAKDMASDIASDEQAAQAEVERLRAAGVVNPKTVKQYGMIWHRMIKNSDGTAARAKVTRVTTWKTDQSRWEIAWKHGMRDFGVITPHNAADWTTVEPQPVPRQKRRR